MYIFSLRLQFQINRLLLLLFLLLLLLLHTHTHTHTHTYKKDQILRRKGEAIYLMWQERDEGVAYIYLALKRVFDKVHHKRVKRLLETRKCRRIEGGLLKWMEDFLSKREMRTVIKDQKSEWCSVKRSSHTYIYCCVHGYLAGFCTERKDAWDVLFSLLQLPH